MKTIWYIHGAGASERSFAWLQEQFPAHQKRYLTYDISESAIIVTRRLRQQIVSDDIPVILVGHSLGGIIARGAAELSQVQKIVSLSAPFGGIRQMDVMSAFSFEPVVHDMRTFGPLVNGLQRYKINIPHLAIVGTNGFPFIHEPNDSVVTVSSQKALKGVDYREFDLNHFEVLLSNEVATVIRSFVFENE